MQTTEYSDGRIMKELFYAAPKESAAEMLARKHREAFLQGEVKAISQRVVGRNDPCPCGSGKKFKKCCLGQEWKREERPAGDGGQSPGEETTT